MLNNTKYSLSLYIERIMFKIDRLGLFNKYYTNRSQ